jgi:hypothetical protein
MATLWTSPFPAYVPAFVKSRALGYALSAMFGVGVCLLLAIFAQSRLRAQTRTEQVT